jgi:alpha 1,3-glucosidase
MLSNYILVFARGGFIIPMRERIRKSAELTMNDPFTLNVYVSKDNNAYGYLYLDDGKSLDYLNKNQSQLNRIEYKDGVIVGDIRSSSRFNATNMEIERIVIIGM